MAKRITLAAIAERTGLSRTSVAYILNGCPSHITFSTETRALVEGVARELGYRPSVAAQATATGRTGCIAVLHASGPLPEDLLWSIHDRLAHHGLALGLSRMPDPQVVDPAHVPRVLAAWMADGVLITADRPVPEAVTQAIAAARIPAVVVGLAHGQDAVFPDAEGAGEEATRHLLRLGHRRIAHIEAHPHAPAEMARHTGYATAMRVAGQRPRSLAGSLDTLMAAFAKADRPTAVLTSIDPAIVMEGARRSGLAIPADLSIVAIGNQPWVLAEGAIATWITPWSAVGRTAVDQLHTRLGDADRHLPPLAIAGHLVPGTSLAEPPR